MKAEIKNYRKMFLAMGKDIRVIIIKLADRLHNLRTLKYLRRDRQIANAKETMELYAPLANRLGIYSLKWELEDLAFKYLYPEEYRELVEGIDKKREEKHKKKHTMNNFLKNLGILLIVLGTAVLVLSYVCNWLDYNWPNGIALLAIVVGIIVHIVMNKKIQD